MCYRMCNLNLLFGIIFSFIFFLHYALKSCHADMKFCDWYNIWGVRCNINSQSDQNVQVWVIFHMPIPPISVELLTWAKLPMCLFVELDLCVEVCACMCVRVHVYSSISPCSFYYCSWNHLQVGLNLSKCCNSNSTCCFSIFLPRCAIKISQNSDKATDIMVNNT